MQHLFKLASFCLILLYLNGCGTANSHLPEPVKLDAELASIYQTTCQNCHGNAASPAPQTGDQERWQSILSAGMDTVMERVMGGYRGMPPAGQCFECSPEQLQQLVLYMAAPGDA
ncbi:MAG: c-type cytochrome [Oleiphilaceae bacterium]|nr:c-type cytochrome [Oleiphilaceae bacterium]